MSVLLVASLFMNGGAQAQQIFTPEAAGLRYGLSSNASGPNFTQAETFLSMNLPWLWSCGRGWGVQSQTDVSLGWLGTDEKEAFVGKLGIAGRLFYRDFPLSVTAGTGPTILSHYDFGQRHFGGPFQFTTYIGANLDILERFRVCYRFQHMSNGGLEKPNPGLNLHMVGLSYLF